MIISDMIELFHTTMDLDKVLMEGLKSRYQLELEGKGDNCFFVEYLDNPSTSEITKFLSRSLFFFDEYPVNDSWVSILSDEDDNSVKVGNMNLVDVAYQPGEMYERSVMSLADYIKQKDRPIKPGQDFQNPFTAGYMGWDEMERFKERWGEELEKVVGRENIFEYQAEILVPRSVIEPDEFYRSSLDC